MRARRRVEKDPLESAVFFIDRSAGKKIGGALSKAVLKALGRIRGFIASHRRQFIAKIYRDGRLAKLENQKRFRRSSGDGKREKAGVSRPLSQLCHLCLTWYRYGTDMVVGVCACFTCFSTTIVVAVAVPVKPEDIAPPSQGRLTWETRGP